MAKPRPSKPDHPDHPLAARIRAKAEARGHRHNVAADLLKSPPATHLAALIDRAVLRPETAAAAQAEGDERLVETLDTILAVCEHARQSCEAHGLPVSATLSKAIEGLTLATT